MPNEKLSVQEFAAQIKAKYPEYKEYDDTVLTEAILDKYPVYKGQVDYAPKKKEVTPSPSLGGESPSVVETEPVPNPFFEKLKEVDQAFGQAVAKTPILAELVAGSNSIVGGILDYANMTFDYTRAAMMPGGSFDDKLNYVQQEDDNWSEKAADLFANNQEYIRDTRNTQAGISKEDSYKGIIGLAKEGEYAKSAFLLFSGATESVPSIALAATTGVGTVAASAAGSKYREIEDNPAYSPLEKLLFANASGIVEAMAEKMGGSDLAAFRKIFSKQAAVDQYRNSFIQSVRQSDIYKEFLKGGVEEGLEEAMVTAFDQMVTSIKEGKDIDVDKIIDDFLVGFVAGGGTIVTANGMNARGSIKNEKARAKNAQQIKDLKEKKSEATPQEATTIDSMIKKNVSAMRTLIDQDAEFFSTFSKDDQDRVRAIDRELNSIEKQRGLTSDEEIKFLLQSQSLELYAEKEKIESKYRKEEENLLINNATTEQLDEIRKLEALLADKKQRLDNVESESAKAVIQSQIIDVEKELKAKKQEVIGKVKPAAAPAPQEEFTPEEEPTPVEMQLEVPKEAQPASFEDLLSQRVTFKTPTGKTEMGRIIDEGNGKMAVRTDDGNIIELGNIDDLKGVEASTLGLAKAEEIVSMEGNEITVRGEKYTNNYSNPLAAINRDEDGNIQSVTLDAADGTKRTFRGTAGDEIAYNIIMSQYTDEQLETELENLAQQDEETNAELAPTPEAEVAPAPEAAPDTEQAPEQQPEPEVAPEPTPEPTLEPAKEQTNKDSNKKPLADLYADDIFSKERLAVEKKLIGDFPNLFEFLKDKMKSSFKDYETPVSTISNLYMLNKEGGFTASTPKKNYSLVFKVTTGSKGEWSLFVDNKGVNPISKSMKAIEEKYGSLENFAVALLGGNYGGKTLETAKSIIKDIKEVAEKQYLESDAGKDGMTIMPGQNSVDKFIDKIASKYGLYSPIDLEAEIQSRLKNKKGKSSESKKDEDSLEKKRETNKDLEGRTIPSLRPGGTPSPGLELDIASRLAARGEIMSGNKAPFYRNEEEFYARTIKGQMNPDDFIQLVTAAIINTEIQNQKVLNGEKETPKSELVSKPLDSIERFRMKNDKVEYFGGREIHPKRAWKAIPINKGSGQYDILNSLKAGGSLSKYTANSDKFTKNQILIDAGLKKEEVTATKPKEKGTTKPEPWTPPTKSIPSKQDIIDAERGLPTILKSESDVNNIKNITKLGIGVMIGADKKGVKNKKFFDKSNPKTKYGFIGPDYLQNDIQEVKKRIIEFVQSYNGMINSIPEEARPKDMLIDSRKKAIDAIKSYAREKTDPVRVNKILFDTVTIDGVSKVLTFADAIKQMDDSEFIKLKNYTEKSEKKDTGKPTVIAGVQLTDEEAKRAAGYVPPAEDLKNFYVTKKGEPFTVPNKEWWEVAKKVMNLGSSISVRLDIYEGGYDKNPKRKRTKDAPKNIHIYGSDKNRVKSVKDVLEFEYKGLKGVEAVSALEEDFFFRLPNPWVERDESNGKVKKFKPETVGQVQWGNNGMYGFDMITKARAFDALSKGKGAKKLVMGGYEADNFSDYASESTLPQDIKDLKAEGFDVEKQYISAVAKAFNETEDAVAKALGFKAITDDSEVVAVKFPKTEELVDADVAPSGAYTKQKTQVVNSKELGPIRFTSSMVSKNKQEEFTLQQRIYEEIDSFKLTGPEKIQSPADVAFLLRHLESAASENAFLVVTNQDGDYRTIWLGTGTQSSQVVDELEIAAAVDSARFDMKSEKVFVTFVHNHPSGSLIQSPGDEKVYATFKKYFDSVPNVEFMDGLIVNLDSGKFTTFTDKGRVATPNVAKYEDTVTAPVYSFSRKEIYAPKSERPNPFRGGSDAAQFINKLKINGSNKIGHIVLDISNSVTYVTFVDPSISAAEWARTMVVDTGRYGTNVIIFAPQSEAAKVQSASSAASKMVSKMSVLDTSIGNPRLRTDGNISVFEPSIDYVLLEDAEDNFVKEQGYTPLTEEDLDYPSRLKSFMEAIKGFKWTEVQKEIIRHEEKRSSRVSLRMKVLGKALRELNRDLGGNFLSRKLKGIEKPEAIKAQMLASRYMSEVDKTSVVDEILKLKNGERILKNLRVIRATFDDTSAAFATDSTFQKLPKETRQNILDNIGTYLHRSYRFFDDPTYKFKFGRLGKMMGLDKAARNQAVEAEFMILHNNWINKLMDEAGYTREQAIQSTLLKADNGKNKGFSKRELLLKEAKDNIDKLIKEYNDLLDNRKKMRAQGKGANIPNSAFLEKKDLPVHIRELLGEVKDPIAVMASTGQVLFEIYEKGKMVELISESITNNLKDLYAKEEYRKAFKDLKPEQQKSILDRVNKEPMIKMNKDITERDKGVYKQVNDPMSPLNTRWIHKDIVEIIQASPIYDTDKEGLVGGFIQTYFFILKNMRMTQVLLNSPTWTKNAIGTLYFSLANGWFNPIKQVKNIKAMAEGTLNLNEEYVKMLEEMSENGMIGQSYNVNQIGMSGFAYYYGISGDKSFYDKYVARLRNMAKKGLADLGTTYAAIDDFGKMSIYQNERASFAVKLYGKEYGELTEAQQKKVRAAAAERVKDNTPTWGRITKVGRAFQRAPIGDFQGFRFEAFRSTYRIIANATDDIRTLISDKTLSKEQRAEYVKDIARKMAGIGFVSSSAPYVLIKAASYGTAAAASILSMFGFDDDEETKEQREARIKALDAAVVVRPGWLDKHNIWVRSIDNDLKVRVYDYTGFDPYAEVFDVSNWGGVAGDMFGANMAAESLVALSKNEDVYGRPITDPSDPVFQRIMDYAKYGGSKFVPSVISSSFRDAAKKQEEVERAKRLLKLNGLNPDDFNLEEVNLPKEAAKLIDERKFIRDYEYDMVQQFRYAVKGYKKSFGENYLTTKYPENRKRILDDVREMYQAVYTVAMYKGNLEKIDEVTRIVKTNFDDIEESYIFDPRADLSGYFPKGYFK